MDTQLDNSPHSEIFPLSEIYSVALPRSNRSRTTGEVMGMGTGSSLEFQDYRGYVPGDDLRHIDWRAYARSDDLHVKLYRREICPVVEVVLDMSRSMNSDPTKAKLARNLALLLFRIGAKNLRSRLVCLGDPSAVFDQWGEVARREIEFTSQINPAEILPRGHRFTAQSIRFLISDFLYPIEYLHLAQQVGNESSLVNFIQVLAPSEEDPDYKGRYELVDIETDEGVPVVVDKATISRYKQRLENLRASLALAVRKVRGNLALVNSGLSLADTCSELLLPSGMIDITH